MGTGKNKLHTRTAARRRAATSVFLSFGLPLHMRMAVRKNILLQMMKPQKVTTQKFLVSTMQNPKYIYMILEITPNLIASQLEHNSVTKQPVYSLMNMT